MIFQPPRFESLKSEKDSLEGIFGLYIFLPELMGSVFGQEIGGIYDRKTHI